MNYFYNVFCTYWNILTKRENIKNILICFLNVNESLMGLEQHDVEYERIVIFERTIPLTV